MSEENKQTILQDTDEVKHIIIRVDLKSNFTRIMSGLSLWGNIKMFASGIGVSYRKLLEDGENPITTYKQLEKVIIEMLDTDYDIEKNEEQNQSDKTGIGTGDSNKTESVGVESPKIEGVTDNQQPISKNDHKSQKKNKKSIKSKSKNKKRN